MDSKERRRRKPGLDRLQGLNVFVALPAGGSDQAVIACRLDVKQMLSSQEDHTTQCALGIRIGFLMVGQSPDLQTDSKNYRFDDDLSQIMLRQAVNLSPIAS